MPNLPPSLLPNETYLPCWLRALKEEIGICIITTPESRPGLVHQLYDARKESRIAELSELMLFQIEKDLIFIARKSVELD